MRAKIPVGLSDHLRDSLGRPEVEYDNTQSARPYLFKVEDRLEGKHLAAFGLLSEPEEKKSDLPFQES